MTAQEFLNELKKVLEERNALSQPYTWDQLVADASEIGLEEGEGETTAEDFEKQRRNAVKDAEMMKETGDAE